MIFQLLGKVKQYYTWYCNSWLEHYIKLQWLGIVKQYMKLQMQWLKKKYLVLFAISMAGKDTTLYCNGWTQKKNGWEKLHDIVLAGKDIIYMIYSMACKDISHLDDIVMAGKHNYYMILQWLVKTCMILIIEMGEKTLQSFCSGWVRH